MLKQRCFNGCVPAGLAKGHSSKTKSYVSDIRTIGPVVLSFKTKEKEYNFKRLKNLGNKFNNQSFQHCRWLACLGMTSLSSN